MQQAKLIKASELANWADSTDARALLPELVRRLVHATVSASELEHVNFPGGEEVHRPGYDGETRVKTGNAWVPDGLTCWEMGTDKNKKGKLDGDYDKRLNDRGSGDFSGVAYIAVTPRDYQNAGEWAQEKTKEGRWRDVRVYDSNILEQWLETAPAVAFWLAKKLGKRVQGAQDIASYWGNVQASLKRPLPASIPLISREETVKSIDGWLSGPAQVLEIQAESPREVLDVFSAWGSSLPKERQSDVMSRALIIESAESWQELSGSTSPLILVATDRLELTGEMIAAAVKQGHHVLISVAAGKTDGRRLARINRSKLKDALMTVGLKDAEANALSEHCGGSFTILKRRFQRHPSASVPEWGEASAAADLAPLLLAGAWRDDSPADQQAVAKMLGQPYDKALDVLNRWRAEPDSPVRWSNGAWEFVAPLDAWAFLSPKLTKKQLDAFELVVVDVLGTPDPMYELAADERWCAQIHGKIMPYSGTFRKALTRALALMATQSDTATVTDSLPLQDRVARIVRKILPRKAPWQRWASLDDFLSTLAEAAPGAMLDVMEDDLREADSALVKLFAEEGNDGFTGRAEHVGMLWALERMAWSPEHLPRVALILAALAEKDPGGRIANRPDSSLRDTFCNWHPHTAASCEQRLEILETLVKRHPKVGWELLLELFPEGHSSISLRATPEWRFWAENWSREITNGERHKGDVGVIRMAYAIAAKESIKWPELLKLISRFPKQEFLDAVASARLAAETVDDALKYRMWESLQALIRRHRGSPDAEWVLPEEALVALEALRDVLRPEDPSALAIPLFTRAFDTGWSSKVSWDELERLHRERKRAAVKAVIDAQGFGAVLTLAQRVEDPRALGMGLAAAVGVAEDGKIVPGMLLCGDKVLEQLANGYAVIRMSEGGLNWVKTLPLLTWKPAEAGLLLAPLAFSPVAWDYAKSLGEAVETAYWEHAQHYFSHGLPPDAIEHAARKLIGVGRPISALQMLGRHANDAGCPPPLALLELTELALSAPKHEDWKLDSYEVEQIVVKLQSDSSLDQGRLGSLEWNLLPALRGEGGQPRTLLRELSNNSGLFVELLTTLYRPKNRDKSADTPPSEKERFMAERARELLHEWKTVPGLRADGTVDPAALTAWVKQARERAAEMDRKEICDDAIGKALAHAPGEEDGSWPCVPVRELIDDVNSPELAAGFSCGVVNKRGAFWRAKGGQQERSLAEQYGGYADACRTRWPRTAAILKELSDRYSADARREDARDEARG